ncbi:PREDICTED: uncharacterized protein LOC109352906 [Lupinus angustifolius]|uniref:uncharacterized protein LOC109352906 n=1 Tax=Lupinus angustifolius TaxID=3871 RepID=UPI00092EE051|nr:PREDICTED: uncharacterized protein LOC109352906 [Lupinus angustifolius]
MIQTQGQIIQQQAQLLAELRQHRPEPNNGPSRPVADEQSAESVEASRNYYVFTTPKYLTRPSNIEQYDGISDPRDHLDAFEASMIFHGATDPIMCQAFPLTLKRDVLHWFTRLAPNSIEQWATLTNGFNIRFTTSREQPHSSYTLSDIRQESHEPLRAYLDRFNLEAMMVRTLSLEVAVHILVTSLHDGLFRQEFAKYSGLTMEELRSKAQQFINLEETHPNRPPTEHRDYQIPSREAKRPKTHEHPRDDPPRQPKKPKYNSYTPSQC